jgi:hypothetical protein
MPTLYRIFSSGHIERRIEMKSSDEKYYYYKPGEVFYLLSHDLDLPTDTQTGSAENTRSMKEQSDRYKNKLIFDEVVDNLFKVCKERALSHRLDLSLRKDNELHFPATIVPENQSNRNEDVAPEIARKLPEPRTRRAFSIIPAEVKRSDKDPEEFANGPELSNLVLELDGDMRNAQPDLGQGITLEAVTLNWLASPGSEWGGGGGPGGLPEPYQPDPAHPEHVPFRFDIPSANKLLALPGAKQGEGVTVAILDTAPCPHDLAAAYECHHKVNPENQGEYHELLEYLLAPDNPLIVHPASLEDLLRMRAVHLRDHNYQMTDHGLFVAGIIRTIAPRAKLHLFEVLNPDGVGDLLSIAKGLWEVLNAFSGQRLVVNCSLVLNIPRLNEPITDLDSNIVTHIVGDADNNQNSKYLTSMSSEGKKWLARQGLAIEWICDQLLSERSRVIAAAGNDWKQGENEARPDPRFPAAFSSALGIGALKKAPQTNENHSQEPSSYSNISDKPEDVGIMALGGEPGEKKGVLGVYIGKFPPMKFWLRQYPAILRPFLWLYFAIHWGSFSGPQNKSDWAWWAGTSFATPIVTGVIASVFSDKSQSASVEDVLIDLYSSRGVTDSLLPTKEDGIADVTQI